MATFLLLFKRDQNLHSPRVSASSLYLGGSPYNIPGTDTWLMLSDHAITMEWPDLELYCGIRQDGAKNDECTSYKCFSTTYAMQTIQEKEIRHMLRAAPDDLVEQILAELDFSLKGLGRAADPLGSITTEATSSHSRLKDPAISVVSSTTIVQTVAGEPGDDSGHFHPFVVAEGTQEAFESFLSEIDKLSS